MSKKLRWALIILFLTIAVISGGVTVHKIISYEQGAENYEEAEQLAGIVVTEPEEEEEEEKNPLPQINAENLTNLNLAALQEVNSEVLGWILIPGTPISYPLMDGTDNEYYLNRTWDREWNWMGAIFLEKLSNPNFTDFNTIIYGHNVRNGHMFSELRNYTEQSYYNGAPVIYIATEDGIARYDIFAAAEVSTESSAFWLDVENENNRQTFIDQALEASQIETGIVPNIDDKILTLSTCTGNGHATRWVVQAVLAD